MPETAKRTARVPILGEDGRISDDYIPAAIGEGVESAEAAAMRAETAATNAEGSATAAGTSATKAQEGATAAGNAKTAAKTAQKGAESAKTAAETAKAAAEKAKTDAESASTSASNSASQAATSATAAADSAASVADKFITSAQATTLEPGSQATASVEEQVLNVGIPKGDKGDKGDPGDDGHTPQRGVDYWTAEDVEAIVEDAKTQAVAELAEIGNVPKKTVTDLVAHGEDAYAQKPIEVRIKGKTRVNRWPMINGTIANVTASTDDTGLITITGSSDGSGSVTFPTIASGMKANTAYTCHMSKALSWNYGFYIQELINDVWVTTVTMKGKTTQTFTTNANATGFRCGFQLVDEGPINETVRVMLVDGTEAPDCFTPCASIASVETGNLVTSGKNLLPTANITDVGGANNATEYVDLLPGTYTISAQGGPFGQIIVRGDDGTDYSTSNYSTSNATFTLNRSARVRILFWISEETEVFVSNPQLELGSTATPYEPPAITQTPLPEVELRSLTNGTCDELVIKADGSCEVERRTYSYKATGEEDVLFAGGEASFRPTPAISNLAWNENISCDKLPAVSTTKNILGCSSGYDNRIYFMVPGAITDTETAKQWLATNKPTFVYGLDEHTTEPQSTVTLPALPAPTFNQYHDSAVPSDTSTQYVRDINIVLDNLAKQIAGTAATVAINEATR